MSILRMILLLTMAYTALADNTSQNGNRPQQLSSYYGSYTGDVDDERYEYFDFEELRPGEDMPSVRRVPLKPAASSPGVGESRKTIWRGGSSYSGFKRYNKKDQVKKVNSNSQAYAASPPSAKRNRGPINVPIHNKQRANDKRYLEGLQDLADLT